MKFIVYVDPGTYTMGDSLVWDMLRRTVARLGRPDELYIVRTGALNAVALSGLCPVLERAVDVEGFRVVGPSHPLFERLGFDERLRMGRMTVREDGIVQVRPLLWSDRNKDFRMDAENLDENSTFLDIREFRLTERQLVGILGEEALLAADRPAPAPSAWDVILGDDGV